MHGGPQVHTHHDAAPADGHTVEPGGAEAGRGKTG